MFTVMGFTKLSGLFSLKGRVKPVLASNLGALGCFSMGFGSYWPGATFILGSTRGFMPIIANLSDLETNPFPVPYVLKLTALAPLITESAAVEMTE